MSSEWSGYFIFLLFGIIFIALSLLWIERKREEAKTRIKRTIEEQNGLAILIEAQRSNDDKSSFTFRVVYQNSQGERQTSYCRAIYKGDAAGQLFWRGDNVILAPISPSKQQIIDGLPMENKQLRAALSDKTENTATRSDSKEQIISDLTAENERLRAMLAEASNTPNSPT